MKKTEQELSNFAMARYLADTYEFNISDDKLTDVAKEFKYKPKVLIKNYKAIISIKELVGTLKKIK